MAEPQGGFMARLVLRVNGGMRAIEIDDPDEPLLYVDRVKAGLRGKPA